MICLYFILYTDISAFKVLIYWQVTVTDRKKNNFIIRETKLFLELLKYFFQLINKYIDILLFVNFIHSFVSQNEKYSIVNNVDSIQVKNSQSGIEFKFLGFYVTVDTSTQKDGSE